ncbi:hypothetical protein [Roseibium sp. MMSF_3412]|uniref:hypothetical protein n=1 Tax=Roseibium sp. MMSF_3412 TaxID=3046712 RepID=UPI00273F5D92|nr:hypothetical protein [Roseibium sp. MMSF_3412]
MTLNVPVSHGEFFDRLTILEIKREKITDAAKLEIVKEALAEYRSIVFCSVPRAAEVSALTDELRQVNTALWDLENLLREFVRRGDFGTAFVEGSSAVFKVRDRRAEIKSEIDRVLGSDFCEIKDDQRSATGDS